MFNLNLFIGMLKKYNLSVNFFLFCRCIFNIFRHCVTCSSHLHLSKKVEGFFLFWGLLGFCLTFPYIFLWIACLFVWWGFLVYMGWSFFCFEFFFVWGGVVWLSVGFLWFGFWIFVDWIWFSVFVFGFFVCFLCFGLEKALQTFQKLILILSVDISSLRTQFLTCLFIFILSSDDFPIFEDHFKS